MSSSSSTTDDAKFRRGIAALQRFSQNKRKAGSKMRYNPFSEILFSRKRVGIEEKSLSEIILLAKEQNSSVNNNMDSGNGNGAQNSDDECGSPSSSSSSSSSNNNKILFDIVQYTHIATGLVLPPLRERSEVAAATVDDLQVAKVGEIDNTGSFHWPAEDILAHLLLLMMNSTENKNDENHDVILHHHHHRQKEDDAKDESIITMTTASTSTSATASYTNISSSQSSSSHSSSSAKTIFPHRGGIFELGAGVGLAAFCYALSSSSSSSPNLVVVTDGNPRVAQILEANCRTVRQMLLSPSHHHQKLSNNFSSSSSESMISSPPLEIISSLHLPWQIFRREKEYYASSDEQEEGQKHLSGVTAYLTKIESLMLKCQYLVGADCLFFEAFHDDLIQLVLRFFSLHHHHQQQQEQQRRSENLLAPKVVFVAPGRGGSRERFLEKLKTTQQQKQDADENIAKYLHWRILDNYDDQIYRIHQQECQKSETTGYDPDKHYPQVLEIVMSVN